MGDEALAGISSRDSDEYRELKVRYANARKPSDTEAGLKFLDLMNGGHHAELSEWGMPHLRFETGFTCLDMGCGGGANLARMLRHCPEGRVCGIDYSQTSVDVSCETNRDAVSAGRCEVVLGDVADMPFDDCAFDVVTAYETIYFWPDAHAALAEALRVCKPGAQLMVCNEADGAVEESVEWPELIENMTVYTPEQLSQMLAGAGFVDIAVDRNPERGWVSVVGRKPGA